MKIIQVLPYFCFGGAETMCENLTYALHTLGHEVLVVCLYDRKTPISQRMEKAGVRLVFLDKKPGLDLSMLPKLKQFFQREHPDVVHTHLDVIKYAVPAAKLAGVSRCIHTVHSVAHKEAEGILQKCTNHFFYHAGWSVPVALSQEVQQTIVEFYNLPKTSVPVVMNGIDMSRCTPKKDYAMGNPWRFVHVGRLDTPKNQERLLRAFRMILDTHPQAHLTLVGDGALREHLEAVTRELGLEQAVFFAGMQENVRPFLEEADIFVLTSDYEGIPMTILEAIGTGLPIVSTAVGGVPDVVENEKTGLLVPPEEAAVANACLRLAEDASLRQMLGKAALSGSNRFSSQAMSRAYVAIYQN